jgi:PAS domain S-box-containing protein
VSPALLAVAGSDGYLSRFNPAFEVFGYSGDELLSRSWIEFAQPDDRERMLEAAASLERAAAVMALENRVICRDGSLRWVEWTTRVVPEEGFLCAAGRDVTESRRDVTESRRAAEEQAALRRVATLVAKQTPHAEVFALIAEEIGRLLAVDSIETVRYEDDRIAAVVAG